MATLDAKLVRDLIRLWPQVLAIALVLAAGVATLILAIGAFRSLEETRRLYYTRNGFAEIFATVTRAPQQLTEQLGRVPGVAKIDARIMGHAILDIAGMREPATAQVLSLPELGRAALNRPHLRAGRFPDPARAGEVLVYEPFATAHRFAIGDEILATLNGRRQRLRIVGTALSPEFIYAIGPGDLMPDNRRFAVLWMAENVLAPVFKLEGAFNAVSFTLEPGASELEAIRRIDTLLERYGGTGAHTRTDQISHAFLDAELKQLSALARVIPPVFLLVSAFLINMTLMRLITLEREQIGLLKAVGYRDFSIAIHYLKLVGLISGVGIAVGFGLGTWFGSGLTRLYGKFFQFPFLVFERDQDLYFVAAAVSLAAALIGAVRAVLAVVSLQPAVAMRPPAPIRYGHLPGEGTRLLDHISQMTLMSLRNMARWPLRAAMTCLGLAMPVGLLIVSLFAFDSVDHLIDVTFFRAERQDAALNFTDPLGIASAGAVAAMPGVSRVEPYRAVAARLRNGHLSRRVSLVGKPEHVELSRNLDLSLDPIVTPDSGVLVNRRIADVLGLARGDTVEVVILDGRRVTRFVHVADIIESYIGLVVLMRLDQINALLDEGPRISGVNIAYDTNDEGRLFAAVKRTPKIASIELRRSALERFRATLAENINLMTSIYIGLAVIVAFGVVYNAARIQLSEQGRDLASLRVLGFHKNEVARVLLGELVILTLAAQPVGWLIGYGLAWLTIQSFSSDLYTAPFIVYVATFAKATIVTLLAAAVSAYAVRRRIDTLDLIQVLKTRE